MSNTVAEVPQIQQKPRTAADTAIHYGYCAYKDINLASSLGHDHKVQPPESPYYRILPCRELIPFTNIEVAEVDDTKAGTASHIQTVSPIVKKPKTANECAVEMADSYAGWGIVVLYPLTGFNEQDSSDIFRTIQPFKYKLKDIENQLDFDAPERIANEAPYTVTYEGTTVTMQPLRHDLRAVAEEVRGLMATAAAISVNEAGDIKEKTTLSMTNAFRGGEGKRRADPHDKYIFEQFEAELPSLNGAVTPQAPAIATESAESLDLRRRELELREQEIALKRIEMGLDPKPEAPKAEPKPKKGDTVEVDGVEATVTDTRFGRIIATKPSGETVKL